MKQKMKVSIGLCQFLVQILALYALIRVFTPMKNAPRAPLTTPRIIAPGITSEGVTSATLTTPNFRAEAVQ